MRSAVGFLTPIPITFLSLPCCITLALCRSQAVWRWVFQHAACLLYSCVDGIEPRAGKYLSGEAASRREGGWNTDGVFDQSDIVLGMERQYKDGAIPFCQLDGMLLSCPD